jgi:hypothetical protein
MVAKAKKTARTKAKPPARTPGAAGGKHTTVAPSAAGAANPSRGLAAAAVATTRGLSAASEEDLLRLRDATKLVYTSLRDGEADVPSTRAEEYWRDRHLARTAWESAENAAFANLVDQQKQQLPAVATSNADLAKDVQTTATIIAALDVVSASLGIVASVIALLA